MLLVRANEKSNMPKMWCRLHGSSLVAYNFESLKSREIQK